MRLFINFFPLALVKTKYLYIGCVKWLSLLFIGLMLGCSTAPQKDAGTQKASIGFSHYYDLGVDAYSTWEKDPEAREQLLLAFVLLSKAHSMNPHDLATQIDLYRAHYMIIALQNKSDATEKLLSFYNNMHPVARNSLSPPAVLEYQIKRSQKAPPEALLAELHTALQQSPHNSQTWTNIAEYYYDQELFALSAYASKLALEQTPDTAYFAHELGLALSAQAEQRACLYDEKELIKRSVHYMNKAVVLEKENWQYLSNASIQYLNLGLLPLAYSQAQKALALSKNYFTVTRFAEIAILQKRYDEAFTTLENYLSTHDKDINDFQFERIYSLLAILSFIEAEYTVAYKFVYQANEFASNHFYQLHARWLYKSDEQTFRNALNKAENLFPDEKIQVDYLLSDGAITDKAFLAQADSACNKSYFYFVAADRAYNDGQPQQAKEYLDLTLQQNAMRQLSHLWASVLLDTRAYTF